jgi:hypothetical protein
MELDPAPAGLPEGSRSGAAYARSWRAFCSTPCSSLEGVGEAVISKQVVDGTAPPLYICADGSDRAGDASA